MYSIKYIFFYNKEWFANFNFLAIVELNQINI